MLKLRNSIDWLIILAVITLGGLSVLYTLRTQKLVQVFPATVIRDCAPWDGPAFTVSIPYEAGTIINISIWESPIIRHQVKYSLPPDYSRAGQAAYLVRFSSSIHLEGTVSFRRVEAGSPVEGEFDLHTGSGHRLTGKFKAEWKNDIVYCG